jgi:uncharacterized membrane protein YccC
VTQAVKTVVACVVAWVVAVKVFSLPMAFLAPWSALLVVHATVYRTVSDGIRQVGATVVGVFLAWLAGTFIGLAPGALALTLLLAILVGYLPRSGLDGTAVASAAILVLTVGLATHGDMLGYRFLDVGIGIGVGLLVNAVVWPPLRDISAARAIDGVAGAVGLLLRDIAGALRNERREEDVTSWIRRTREIDADIDRAWALLRQARESGRLNPRRGAAAVRAAGEFGEVLQRDEQAVAEIRSMTRTLGYSVTRARDWEPAFRERWVALLDETGAAVRDSDTARVALLGERRADLAEELSSERLPALHWTEYGGLVVALRNVQCALKGVAASGHVSERTGRGRRVPVRG